MDSRQFEAVSVPAKCITKQQEDLYVSLPDLYIRKYVLSEKLCSIKKPYIPKVNLSNHTNLEVLRVPKVWQQVMNDVQQKALDLQERKKWRIAVKYQLAQEAKLAHQLMQKEREEIEQFGICISHQLCVMIEKHFTESNLMEFEEPLKPIQRYINQFEFEHQELDEQRYQEALQKVKRYIATNRDVYVSLENLFPEGPNYSESNTMDVSDRKRIKQTVDFDFKKKYENIQEVLQLFVNRDLPLKESFEKSIMGIEGFPISMEMIYKFKPNPYYQEPCLDPEYEELLYRIGCTPEQVLYDGERMMKKMKIFSTSQVTDAPLPAQLELKDLFRYKHNFIERDCNFIQQNGKFVPLDGEKFNSHVQQITRSNEFVKHYFIYYYQKYQGDFQQISFALSSNTVTANLFLYTASFCADLYAWFVFNKSIPITSKFILPQSYYPKCENIQQQKQTAKVLYTNIVNDYEQLLSKDLPIKSQNLKQLPSNPSKDYKKAHFKELLTKIKFDQPPLIKNCSQADYSMVEKLSFSNLKDLVKSANSSKAHIDKRYKNIYDIARQDCNPMELIKKEYRKNQRQQAANMPGARIYPMPMPGTRMMQAPMPQGYENKAVMPPIPFQPKAQPQQTIEQISNTQPIMMPPQQQPQPQPQPVQQPAPQPVAQPAPAPPQQRPRKKAAEPQPQVPPPQIAPVATPVKKSRKKDDTATQSVTDQPEQVAPPVRPAQQKRTKKQQKANDKKQAHNEEDKDEGA